MAQCSLRNRRASRVIRQSYVLFHGDFFFSDWTGQSNEKKSNLIELPLCFNSNTYILDYTILSH